jgi:antitoxin HigA-1
MKRGMEPVHPGAILREDVLKEMKLSITAAAKGLGVSRKQLSEVVNEVASISTEMAIRLEKGFGIAAYMWLNMQTDYDLWKAERSGRIRNVIRFGNQQKSGPKAARKSHLSSLPC